MFTAIATQASSEITSTGNATIIITTNSSPLYISLSKSSGDIPPNQDLTISGSGSYDPDNPSSALNYIWSCSDSITENVCIGSDGLDLVSD